MDYGTIKKKLNLNIYNNVEEFLNDMSLVFNNCRIYNSTESFVGKIGVNSRQEYERLLGMYNFVERFQNSKQIHPSLLLSTQLQKQNENEEITTDQKETDKQDTHLEEDKKAHSKDSLLEEDNN